MGKKNPLYVLLTVILLALLNIAIILAFGGFSNCESADKANGEGECECGCPYDGGCQEVIDGLEAQVAELERQLDEATSTTVTTSTTTTTTKGGGGGGSKTTGTTAGSGDNLGGWTEGWD